MEIFLIICFGILLFCFLRLVYYHHLRKEFMKKYSLDYLPSSIKIHKIKPKEKNYYTMYFPHWIYANKDGSRDKRRKNNTIYYPGCILYVDQFFIMINNPNIMIQLVNILRKHHVQIQKNKYEKKKEENLLKEKERNRKLINVNNLIDRFKDNPYEFESYCAQLYQIMGVDVEQTSNSNDGGYDLILHYQNGEKGLVECKCYNTSKIGRPLIQKLVGANQIVGAKSLIYITTSDYSVSAREYAEEIGVELINGIELMNLIDRYMRPGQTKVTLNRNEWSLCKEDLKPYVPEDIYNKL